MKKQLLFILIVLCSPALPAQVQLFAGGGLINYQGDLLPRRFTFQQAHLYGTIGVYYELSDKLNLRAGLMVGKVAGADSVYPSNKKRNLSFSSPVMEFHLGAEYDIINSYEHRLVPYVFAGVAAYHFNPSAFDPTRKKVYLQPLGTEGQGIGGTSKYSLTQLAIPFGGGLKFAVNDDVYIRVEAVLRKLFTDYLDDVSTVFADQAALLAANGQQAVDLAFRSDETNPAAVYPNQGATRGNPKSKDFYYTVGASVSFRLQGGGGGGSKKSKTGCPVNVY